MGNKPGGRGRGSIDSHNFYHKLAFRQTMDKSIITTMQYSDLGLVVSYRRPLPLL